VKLATGFTPSLYSIVLSIECMTPFTGSLVSIEKIVGGKYEIVTKGLYQRSEKDEKRIL
jgi:hypothetical protein